jgi:NADH-quinone oxidoreductase subunit H
MSLDIFLVTQMLAKIIFVIAVCLGVIPFIVWFERRGAAWMQGRVGPNRVGPFGLLQPLADVVKFFFKEDWSPRNANKFYYFLAPALALIAPLVAMTIIPFGSFAIVNDQVINLQIAHIDSGVLFLLAFAGLEVYPIILAGWASNNKYSVFGALRGSSQIVSYEISMGLALLSILIVYGSFDPHKMVEFQNQKIFGIIPMWGVFLNPIGALIFWIATFAETNRLPFDLAEGEAELVAGYHLEYGAMKFAVFFMAEYVAMIMASAFLATLFFGGYNLLPGMHLIVMKIGGHFGFGDIGLQNLKALFQFISLFTKVAFFMFVMIWIRWTLPRFRFDQLMDLGWKILFPLALANLVFMSGVVYFLNR